MAQMAVLTDEINVVKAEIVQVKDAVTTLTHGNRCLHHPIHITLPLRAFFRLPGGRSLRLVFAVDQLLQLLALTISSVRRRRLNLL